MAAMTANKSSDPGALLKAWGVDFNPREVIGDLEHALQVAMRQGDQPVRHLGILGMDASSFNPKDVVDAGLSNVNFATVGHVARDQGRDDDVRAADLVEHAGGADSGGALRDAVRSEPAARGLQADRARSTRSRRA